MQQPTGLCATCRFVAAELVKYTARPWDVSYTCVLRAQPLAPHALYCYRYEREQGAD